MPTRMRESRPAASFNVLGGNRSYPKEEVRMLKIVTDSYSKFNMILLLFGI